MKKTIFLGALCLMNVVLFAEDYELRILTFEDEDAKFEPYTLDYVDYWTGKEIFVTVVYCKIIARVCLYWNHHLEIKPT